MELKRLDLYKNDVAIYTVKSISNIQKGPFRYGTISVSIDKRYLHNPGSPSVPRLSFQFAHYDDDAVHAACMQRV